VKSFKEMLVEKTLSPKDKKKIDREVADQQGPHALEGNDLIDYLSDSLGLSWDTVNSYLKKK